MAQLTRDELKEALLSLKKTRHVSESIDNFIDSVWNLLDDGAGGGGGTPSISALSYSATLNQNGGGGNIDAAIGINTLSGAIEWTQISAATHEGVLTGAFPVNKTHVLISNGTPNGTGDTLGAYRLNDDTIRIKCSADGDISAATILIWIDP